MSNIVKQVVSVLFLFFFFNVCNWIAGYMLAGWRNVFVGVGNNLSFNLSAFLFLVVYLLMLLVFFTLTVSKNWKDCLKHGWKFIVSLIMIRLFLDLILLQIISNFNNYTYEIVIFSNVYEVIYTVIIFIVLFFIHGNRKIFKEHFVFFVGRNVLSILTVCCAIGLYLWIVQHFYGANEVAKTFYTDQLDLFVHNMELVLMHINEWFQCIVGTCLFYLFKNSTILKTLIKKKTIVEKIEKSNY